MQLRNMRFYCIIKEENLQVLNEIDRTRSIGRVRSSVMEECSKDTTNTEAEVENDKKEPNELIRGTAVAE